MTGRRLAVALAGFLIGAGTVLAGAASAQDAKMPTREAIFAGGCFWCMEPPFDKLDGVVSTTSGYTGGSEADATYKRVSSGGTAHFEALRVVYDPSKVTYERLLEVFWRNVDPHDATGQFCDKGRHYRAAIFTADDEERRAADASKQALSGGAGLKEPVVTEVLPATAFYPAEEYHQDYYLKNPLKYRFYRATCGRDARLDEVWGAATH